MSGSAATASGAATCRAATTGASAIGAFARSTRVTTRTIDGAAVVDGSSDEPPSSPTPNTVATPTAAHSGVRAPLRRLRCMRALPALRLPSWLAGVARASCAKRREGRRIERKRSTPQGPDAARLLPHEPHARDAIAAALVDGDDLRLAAVVAPTAHALVVDRHVLAQHGAAHERRVQGGPRGEHLPVARAHGLVALHEDRAVAQVAHVDVLGVAGHEGVDVVRVVGVELTLGEVGGGH